MANDTINVPTNDWNRIAEVLGEAYQFMTGKTLHEKVKGGGGSSATATRKGATEKSKQVLSKRMERYKK